MDSHLRRTDLPLPSTFSKKTATPLSRLFASLINKLTETTIPAFIIALAIVLLIMQPTTIDGRSMEPTLSSGQYVVIEKLSYSFSLPQRGEIAVLTLPEQEGEALIKRVIATEGDRVAIQNGQVYLNDKVLSEAYVVGLSVDNFSPLVVPAGYLFVLGDNRNYSNDSRHFGLVPLDHVVGRAAFSYWPLNTFGTIN